MTLHHVNLPRIAAWACTELAQTCWLNGPQWWLPADNQGAEMFLVLIDQHQMIFGRFRRPWLNENMVCTPYLQHAGLLHVEINLWCVCTRWNSRFTLQQMSEQPMMIKLHSIPQEKTPFDLPMFVGLKVYYPSQPMLWNLLGVKGHILSRLQLDMT